MTIEGTWRLSGADGETILGNTHAPPAGTGASGAVLIAHGFKGYKDYGMFPAIATAFADAGFVAHRFNFSHGGMTDRTETFERPDLFERDTWNRQVEDLRLLIEAHATGELPGSGGGPLILLGHSRGGVSVLLAVGRHGREPAFAALRGVITVAAPSTCLSMSGEQQAELLEAGFLVSPSSRTGQDLRVGKVFLQEQLDDPAGHDLPALVGRITVPLLVIHGENDPTVPAASAEQIAAAATDARPLIVPGGDHVMNTPNPFPADSRRSPQLQQALDAAIDFARERCG